MLDIFLLSGRQRHDIPFQKAMAIASSLGYFAHLLLDEYSSLNFDGHRFKPKRSLGTALDFIKPKQTRHCDRVPIAGGIGDRYCPAVERCLTRDRRSLSSICQIFMTDSSISVSPRCKRVATSIASVQQTLLFHRLYNH